MVAFAACERAVTNVTVSSDAKLASFSLRANDSIPQYATAVFKIEELEDTGKVYNADSLKYMTPLDSVVPYFRFNSTPALARAFVGKDTIDLTGNDTLNFTVQPVKLFVVAADLKTTRWYNIYINVHQIDPNLFTWRQLSKAIADKNIEQQKALWFNHKLYWFVRDALGLEVYTSTDGAQWQREDWVLPEQLNVSTLVVAKGKLAGAGTDGNLYFSSDGEWWNYVDLSDYDVKCENLLFEFADSLWLIISSNTDKAYYLATTTDFSQIILESDELPASFPVSDFAAATFISRSYRPRAIVIGGYSADGLILNSRWSAEEFDGLIRWVDYSESRFNFQPVAGTQVVYYNDMLLMLGGMEADNKLRSKHIYQSEDEGLTWTAADTLSNAMPEEFSPRYRHSFFADDDDNLYVVGGQSLTKTFSDVYTGKLGELDFE